MLLTAHTMLMIRRLVLVITSVDGEVTVLQS